MPEAKDSLPQRLIIQTYQEQLGFILSDQLNAVFDDKLDTRRLLFRQLDQFKFHSSDLLLAFSDSSLNISTYIHRDLNHAILGKRTVNQLYLNHILELPKRRI